MVDIPVDIRLTSLVKMLSEGYTQGHIARELKLSRQAVSKAIKRMKAQGLITEAPESSYHLKFYHVNQSLVQPDNPSQFDLHNIEATIPVERLGSLPEGQIDMKNWRYAHLDYGFFDVFVNYGKETKLKILPPKDFGDNISEVLVRAGSRIDRLARMIETHYGCKVDMSRMKVTRRPHLHPLNDPVLKGAEKLGIQYTGRNITLDQSGDGHGDVIGFDSIAKYDNMFDTVPKEIEEIRRLIGGSAATQNAIANTQMMMASAIKLLVEQKNVRMERKRHILTHRRGD